MNRLFDTLRGWLDKNPTHTLNSAAPDALPGFDNRIEVLCHYAENAARYEDDLLASQAQISDNLGALEAGIDKCLLHGADRDALEYVRLMVRLRPQYELIDQELRSFHAVASELILRTNLVMQHIDEARQYAASARLNPAATNYLDDTLTKLTRYFVMLERVAEVRRRELPARLAALTLSVIDNRRLDMELANYILQRRRALGSGD
jgi:hypothetical protein